MHNNLTSKTGLEVRRWNTCFSAPGCMQEHNGDLIRSGIGPYVLAEEYDRLTADNKALREALLKCIEAMDWEIGGEPLPTLMIAARDAARAALEGVKP